MEQTLIPIETKVLSTVGQRRSINQLAGQMIEFRWDFLSLQLRTIDLWVLRQEFDSLLQEFNIESEEDYILWINHQVLYLTKYDIWALRELLHEATERLPYQVVRWKEVTLSLCPCDSVKNFTVANSSLN